MLKKDMKGIGVKIDFVINKMECIGVKNDFVIIKMKGRLRPQHRGLWNWYQVRGRPCHRGLWQVVTGIR